MKATFQNFMISQNKDNGTIILFEILDNGKYAKRFRCDSPKNKRMKYEELLHLGKHIVKYVLPIGKWSTLCCESQQKKPYQRKNKH